MPTHNEILLSKYFDQASKTVLSYLRKRYHFDCHTLESLCADGIEYAALYYLTGANAPTSFTADDLAHLAFWSASNRAKDLLRHQKRHPESLALDGVLQNEEGADFAESATLIEAADAAWRRQNYDREWQALGDFALTHLEDMFDLLGLNALRRAVFSAIYLEGEGVAEVCARHGIKPNYAYGIVFGVKKGLAEIGPAYLKAA